MTTTPPTPPVQDFIRYDLLTQRALRGVVREVLARVAREGVPGDHHFYVSFRTTAPGVQLSSRLREKYPEEMTIVLQHQFWDLDVSEAKFEVGLSFGNVPERLSVPFDAVTGFLDPYVQFRLHFDDSDLADAEDAPDDEAAAPEATGPGSSAALEEQVAAAAAEGGAEVVSLDKFRKK